VKKQWWALYLSTNHWKMEYQLKTGGVLRYRDWLVELGLRHMNYFCIDFEHLHSASSSNNIKIKSSCSATLQLMCHHTLHIIIKFLAFPGKQTHRIPDFWFAARQKAPSIRIDHD
jgi:hypothetical protein